MEKIMKHIMLSACKKLLAVVTLWVLSTGTNYGQVKVVNMIPQNRSCETNQDSEPNLAVNSASANQIAGSAFTPGAQPDCVSPAKNSCPANLAPIFVSTDGGNTWSLNCIVPSDAVGMTGDITTRFGGTTNNFYAGILRRPGFLRLNILRTNNFVGPAAMTVLVDRNSVDQPYVQATTAGGNDRVYVGDNDFNGPGGRTATIDQSLNANAACCPPAPPPPLFNSIRIESRGTGGQDGPPIRPAIHSDGTIYAAFYGWRAINGNFSPNATITTDVVVVRDDTGGTGVNPFTALVDTDGLAGRRVVQRRIVPWANFSQPNFGQERFVGSNITIAVDPSNSSTVYVAWADRVGNIDYTLHVRRSLDRGVTWSNDLRTITNATNPALAIRDNGTVGFLYQQLTGTGADQRWVTHFERTNDAFTTIQDLVLANVPATSPAPQFIPYIGDYVHLTTVGSSFYGIFSANNTPNNANFPSGVSYQRNANFTTNTLLNTDNVSRVATSIDPFFFKVEERQTDSKFQYAVKFVCGKSEGEVVAPGKYFTAINVHNPTDKAISFRKKIAVALPSEKAGPVSRFFTARLGPDEALEIDCPDIFRHMEARVPFLKGFVVIESDVELDVVAVYTAAGEKGFVETIDIERVSPQGKQSRPEGLPDLVPVPHPNPGIGFCNRVIEGPNQGKLVVTVKNQGTVDAPASVTTVEFIPGGAVQIATPPIAAGASVDLPPLTFPIGCFNPDCNFRITVDSGSQVNESNEGNNSASGTCIG